MPNKTIYVANEELWERAKKLAGNKGLSSVISQALADYVASRSAQDASLEKFHFEIGMYSDSPTEVIGFEGKQLISKTFDLAVNPFDQSDSEIRGIEAVIQIYRTRLGKFVLLARPTDDQPESVGAFVTYESHSSVKDVMSGNVAACLHPPNRHELLQDLTNGLGKDAVTWID